jgi:mono/diheme cytochrome c family protein
MRTRTQFSAIMVVFLFSFAGLMRAQESNVTIKKVPAPHTNPASGQEMYVNYCASCHGKTGTGNGPAAPALKESVPDLTTLTKQNKGVFPSAHISSVISGRDGAAHGSSDMPVWGPIFRSLRPGDQAEVQQRVTNLTEYLKSLQAK